MTKTDMVKLVKALKTLPYPVAHTVFLQPQTPPYLIYLDETFTVTAASSTSIVERTEVQLELYTKGSQTAEAEDTVEAFLGDFTTYEKSRSYIESEQLYITYYTFTL